MSQLSGSWCFLSHTRWNLQAPLPCSAMHAALGGKVPAESGGEESCAMCGDLAPSSPAVGLPSAAPAPIEQRRLQAGSCQLSKPDRTPGGIPHLEKPSLGIGTGASVHSHLYYYLQSYLENIIFQMQRFKRS